MFDYHHEACANSTKSIKEPDGLLIDITQITMLPS